MESSRSDGQFSRSGIRIFLALIAIILLIAAVTAERSFSATESRSWTQHTFEVQGAIQRLHIAVLDAESGERGFLLTGNAEYLAPYQAHLARSACFGKNCSD